MTQEALKLALELLESAHVATDLVWKRHDAVEAIKEALAQTERPADCERCNRLEEQAYDLVGKLRVANIKLSMQPQRTWVKLMRGVRVEGDSVVISVKGGNEAARELCGELLKEKNT